MWLTKTSMKLLNIIALGIDFIVGAGIFATNWHLYKETNHHLLLFGPALY